VPRDTPFVAKTRRAPRPAAGAEYRTHDALVLRLLVSARERRQLRRRDRPEASRRILSEYELAVLDCTVLGSGPPESLPLTSQHGPSTQAQCPQSASGCTIISQGRARFRA